MADEHDPLERQLPDEPRFVLLGRDQTAADLVRLWLALRKRDNHLIDQIVKRLKNTMTQLPYQPNKTPGHILSAQAVANNMDLFLYKHYRAPVTQNGETQLAEPES